MYIAILHFDVVCHSINGLSIQKIEGKKICMSYISIITTKLQYLDVLGELAYFLVFILKYLW